MGTIYPWSHEKKLRIRDDESDYLEMPSVAPKKKQSKKICKKLKGEHVMELAHTKIYKFFPRDGKGTKFEEFRCIGCGKKDVTFTEVNI